MPDWRVNMLLPGISQHKCRHHTITQGTVSPKVSDYTAWSNVGASNVYLEMPDRMYRVGPLHRAQTHGKTSAFYGFAPDVRQSTGQKPRLSWPCWPMSGSEMTNLPGLPEPVVKSSAPPQQTFPFSWPHSSCRPCFAERRKDAEAGEGV